MKKLKWPVLFISLILLSGFFLKETVYASLEDNPEKEICLTIQLRDSQKAVPGVKYEMFRIADLNLNKMQAFSDYPLAEFYDMDEETFRTLPYTMEGYVLRDSVKSDYSAVTDKEGKAKFPEKQNEKLEKGYYLIIGHQAQVDGKIYTPKPAIVRLPQINPLATARINDEKEEDELYDIDMAGKFDVSPASELVTSVEISVIKIWKGENNKANLPKEITVQLLKNKKVYDTVALNERNNWRHTWKNLDPNAQWNITEKITIDDNYYCEITKDKTTFLIKNTKKKSTQNPPSPKSPQQKPNRKLPQTGQNWWLVYSLLSFGLLFITIGILIKRSEYEN